MMLNSADGEPVVSCLDVRKNYGRTVALAGLDLRVERGSLYALLGPNGAGKSTLVKILTGLVRPGGGTVRVLGGSPSDREVRQRLGYLPEHFRFPPWLTGRELLLFHARLAGVPIAANGLLDLVGIGRAGDRRIGEYSKGMQQRLGLAQALVGEPQIVFLDEPTSALDPLGRLEVRDILLHLKERGVAVFLNSHLLTEVEKVSDQIAIIDRGTVVAEGSLQDLLRSSEARLRLGEAPPERLRDFVRRLEEAGLPAPVLAAGGARVPVTGKEQLAQLVRAAVESGLEVYEALLARESLEDTFVRLIHEHEDEKR